MARSRRVFAAPLVVVAVSLMPGCSGKIEGDPRGDGDGDTGGSTGGDLGSNTGGGPPVDATGGIPPIGGNPPYYVHPCEPPFENCELLPACPLVDKLDVVCVPDDQCRLDTTCAGERFRGHVLTCVDEGDLTSWQLDPAGETCQFEFEQCLNQTSVTALMLNCVDSSWHLGEYDENFNPPAPCPTLMPDDGAHCMTGDGFGSAPEACGYPCADGAWSVTKCIDVPGSDEIYVGSWESDGRCLGIGGSAGGSPLD